MVVGLNSILYLLCFVFGVDHNCYIWESQVSHLITTLSWAAHGSIKSNTPKEQPIFSKKMEKNASICVDTERSFLHFLDKLF